MVFLEKIGLAKDAAEQIRGTIEHLKSTRERMAENSPSQTNSAKQLAQLIHGKIPIIYAGPTMTDVAAMRWKTQVCENSKILAFSMSIPSSTTTNWLAGQRCRSNRRNS